MNQIELGILKGLAKMPGSLGVSQAKACGAAIEEIEQLRARIAEACALLKADARIVDSRKMHALALLKAASAAGGKTMTRRFVAGDRLGNLRRNTSKTAREFLRERGYAGNEAWWKLNWPVIYELVPVAVEEVKPKATKVERKI